ncbi:hypothetical protein RFI_17309 [Reticulomyxa filosa]|uniref:CTP synthase N-terminal domain-containing protein n=1 Tax=Reticulomyxa filosa TaxID=46433 RepID=X6N1J7_RETFI|nr:hypothetical protein RFI_17309 [Reticulomyxa filosa]|eukprot:ETO19911.1 hypothetical protein RFI_17309 [Reticulomyxa filosa]
MKFVVVTGGVVSGIGKGITASSIGRILKECNLKDQEDCKINNKSLTKQNERNEITIGTMSPYEHGEVYVLDDGGEVDLDLGNYERFLDVRLTKDHNITTGKIYKHVLTFIYNTKKKKRGGRGKQKKKKKSFDNECLYTYNNNTGGYLGKTVQMIPHVTDATKNWITRVSQVDVDGSNQSPDVCIIELGGTVGALCAFVHKRHFVVVVVVIVVG